MAITTLSSRDFNHDASGAAHAATNGRQEPMAATAKIADLLAMAGGEDVVFEPPQSPDLPQPADLA